MINTLLLITGIWRGVLTTAGGELPFNIDIETNGKSYNVYILNGDERLLMDAPIFRDDSLILNFPVYETALHVKVIDDKIMQGHFINHTKATNNTIPFYAEAGIEYRFYNSNTNPEINVTGKYAVTFLPGTSKSSFAVGLFKQDGTTVTGTFMKKTGDYRFLEGTLINDSLFLSGFDGIHVFLFKAHINGNSIDGNFYSGTNPPKKWSAVLDENAALPDAAKITSVNTNNKPFSFSFPDTDSITVSLNDDRFKGKVVIVQILGSWCPNCLDESKFLAPFYNQNKSKGVEIVGLAFEKTDDFKRAAANVKRLKERINIEYPVLIASNRKTIKETMPQLENFIAFPTTIFLDKNHQVRKVHAGFSGPATGKAYDDYVLDFTKTVEKLLDE
jgi:thiol-disulfide isomerase/thioredoxin